MFLACHSPVAIYLHAGVLEWKGKALVLPGISYSGKTTLVQELVRLGARFYSDEYAIIDTKGRVHPFPSPLSIREGPTARRVDATELGWPLALPPEGLGSSVLGRHQRQRRGRSPGDSSKPLDLEAIDPFEPF